MNTVLKIKKINRFNVPIFTAYLIVIDMILGGSGHLIDFGPISIRMLIFGFLLLQLIGLSTKGKVKFTSPNNILFLTILYYLINLIFSVGLHPENFDTGMDLFFGYFFLVESAYFIAIMDDSLMQDIVRLFRNFTLVLAVFTILLWLYSYIRGVRAVYSQVNAFLQGRYLGFFDTIGSIPRIFLKDGVFVCIGFLFVVYDIMSGRNKENKHSILQFGIYAVAIICSFAAASYLFTVVSVAIMYLFYRGKKSKRMIALVLLVIAGAFFILQTGVLDTLLSRYTGSYNPFQYRQTQMQELWDETLKNPIFGRGLGHSMMMSYSTEGERSRFENSWSELLMNTGLVGLALYVVHIFWTLKHLYYAYKHDKDDTAMVLMMGVLFLCMYSFANPYMNNAIGITYYSICCGIAYHKHKKRNNEKRYR